MSSYETASSDLLDAQHNLENALDNEIRGISNIKSYVHPSHHLQFVDPINITIESLDDFKTLLEEQITEFEYLIPEMPEEITEGVDRDKEHVFEAAQLDALAAILDQEYNVQLQTHGFSIDGAHTPAEAIQIAMAESGLKVLEDETRDTIDNKAIEWASAGYELAPGALSYDIANIVHEFDKRSNSQASAASAKIANMIQANHQSAFENGMQIEDLHMQFARAFTQFKYKKIEASIRAYTAEIEKIEMEMKAPTNAIKSIIKAAGVENVIITSTQGKALEVAMAELSSWVKSASASFKSTASYHASEVGLAIHIAEGYGSILNSYSSLFTDIALEELSAETE